DVLVLGQASTGPAVALDVLVLGQASTGPAVALDVLVLGQASTGPAVALDVLIDRASLAAVALDVLVLGESPVDRSHRVLQSSLLGVGGRIPVAVSREYAGVTSGRIAQAARPSCHVPDSVDRRPTDRGPGRRPARSGADRAIARAAQRPRRRARGSPP